MSAPSLSIDDLRCICLDAGADDAGFVHINCSGISSEQKEIMRMFPDTKTVVSLVKRANRDSIRSPSLSVADWEFARSYSNVANAASEIIQRLGEKGICGIAVPPGFPMDMTRWPGKIWDISHKTIAEQAGMGRMGINRVVIHPEFGNHITLTTVLIDAGLDRYDKPLDESPCIQCGLCVSVCPVGAINKDKGLDFMSCAMHNYHELFGGFQEWIETIVSSRSINAYRSKFRDSETGSRWQSLTYGHAYRCSYCMAVCPAGKETAKTFLADRKSYVDKFVEPLKAKDEPVYVIAGTRAEKTAAGNRHKEVRYVRNTIRPATIDTFLEGAGLLFNPEKAKGLNLTIHFEFTGNEEKSATITIADGVLTVQQGFTGIADLRVRADSETWIKMLNEEVSLIKALITGRLKLKGNPSHLKKFKGCML
jgi:epoxyqueuosine reductase QueG